VQLKQLNHVNIGHEPVVVLCVIEAIGAIDAIKSCEDRTRNQEKACGAVCNGSNRQLNHLSI